MLCPMSPSAKFLNVRVALGITDTIPLDSWHANLFLARSKLPNYDSPGLYFSVFLLENRYRLSIPSPKCWGPDVFKNLEFFRV